MPLRRMRARHEFLAANRGHRFPMPGLVLLIRPRGDGDLGIGVGTTVSKKVGNAVTRNRVKRRFRELARAALSQRGIAGADHVLIGRPDAAALDFATLSGQFDAALARAARKLSPP